MEEERNDIPKEDWTTLLLALDIEMVSLHKSQDKSSDYTELIMSFK
jgi:hypothetical protein